MSRKDLTVLTDLEQKIYLIRGEKVMLDSDLAKLYGVSTKRLNEQVRRNLRRFPLDFTFRLTHDEVKILRSQIATSSWGGHRYLPFVFTEQGIAMLSSVLNSDRAICVNIAIMRAFVKLRKVLSVNKELADQLKKLEARIDNHDSQIKMIFEAIRRLMVEEQKPKEKIGFKIVK